MQKGVLHTGVDKTPTPWAFYKLIMKPMGETVTNIWLKNRLKCLKCADGTGKSSVTFHCCERTRLSCWQESNWGKPRYTLWLTIPTYTYAYWASCNHLHGASYHLLMVKINGAPFMRDNSGASNQTLFWRQTYHFCRKWAYRWLTYGISSNIWNTKTQYFMKRDPKTKNCSPKPGDSSNRVLTSCQERKTRLLSHKDIKNIMLGMVFMQNCKGFLPTLGVLDQSPRIASNTHNIRNT